VADAELKTLYDRIDEAVPRARLDSMSEADRKALYDRIRGDIVRESLEEAARDLGCSAECLTTCLAVFRVQAEELGSEAWRSLLSERLAEAARDLRAHAGVPVVPFHGDELTRHHIVVQMDGHVLDPTNTTKR
jgi:hypothetical protein